MTGSDCWSLMQLTLRCLSGARWNPMAPLRMLIGVFDFNTAVHGPAFEGGKSVSTRFGRPQLTQCPA